ncbi:MAG: threonylcarbamoyl-AMP synthase [Schwartzia sp.]|nr:threonylcarbamoyl-AMP synthase [Schwartzia sp. (in: firmicutes)]
MRTRIAKITDIKKDAAAIEKAGALLRAGALVAFPTETVYGLGANGLDAEACAKIYEAKGRPSDNPLILHVADRAMVDMAAATVTEMAERVMAAFMPGPVTVILPKRGEVPAGVTGGLPTVGIRMPDNDIARAMIRAAGVPIAAPSANLSGRPSPTTAAAVMADMAGRIPLVLDGGPCRFGVESTIVDCTGEEAVILRPGAVTREMLEEVLEVPVRFDAALLGENETPRAPGMKYTHYAPRAPLTLIAAPREKGSPREERRRLVGAFREAVREAAARGTRPGVIVSRETAEALSDLVPPTRVAVYGRAGDLSAMAAHLYESLRFFDDKEADVLFAEAAEETGLGVAIMNRLKKAAGGSIRHA